MLVHRPGDEALLLQTGLGQALPRRAGRRGQEPQVPLRGGARARSRVGTSLGVCVSLARRLCRSLRPQAGILVLSKAPVNLRESPLDLLLRANGLLCSGLHFLSL